MIVLLSAFIAGLGLSAYELGINDSNRTGQPYLTATVFLTISSAVVGIVVLGLIAYIATLNL